MLIVFYRLFLESVLNCNSVTKSEIEEIESIRQKYHISLSDHISILLDMEEGIALYCKYLEDFGILSVCIGIVL